MPPPPPIKSKSTPQLVTSGGVYDTPYAYGPVPGDSSDLSSANFYGYLYNWCAAAAGGTASGGSNTCTATGGTMPQDATGDICPANWRLPTGGDTGEFAWLNAKMNNPSASSPMGYSADPAYYNNWQFTGAWRGVFAGNRYLSYWGEQYSSGYWWSSSRYPSGSEYAFYLSVNSSYVFPGSGTDRGGGFSVRCLVKY